MGTRSVEWLLQQIVRGKPLPAILLLGKELYLRDLCREKLVEACVPNAARDWALSRYSAADDRLERILGQAQTLPMLASRQVVFVEEVDAWESSDEEARDAVLERLGGYLEDPAPFTMLVLEAASLDERRKLFKLLSEKAVVVKVELSANPEERAPVAAVIAQEMARRVGAELGRDAAEELADILNGDLTAIHTELSKLAAYAGEGKRITRADVAALVVSAKRYSVWQLAEMLASRKLPQALAFLDRLLREGEQPAGVVGAMAWMYRKLIEARELPADLPDWRAARDLRMRQATAELALRESRKFTMAQLLDGLAALYEADSRLKSGVRDPRAVMEFLVARLTGPVPAPRA